MDKHNMSCPFCISRSIATAAINDFLARVRARNYGNSSYSPNQLSNSLLCNRQGVGWVSVTEWSQPNQQAGSEHSLIGRHIKDSLSLSLSPQQPGSKYRQTESLAGLAINWYTCCYWRAATTMTIKCLTCRRSRQGREGGRKWFVAWLLVRLSETVMTALLHIFCVCTHCNATCLTIHMQYMHARYLRASSAGISWSCLL